MKILVFLTIAIISSCAPEKECVSIEVINYKDKNFNEADFACTEKDSFLYFKLTNHSTESFEVIKSLYYSCPTYEPENVVFFDTIEGENNTLKDDGLLTKDMGGKFESDTISSFQVSYFMMKKIEVDEWLLRSPYILVRLPFIKIVSKKEGHFELLLRRKPKCANQFEKADTMLLPADYIKRGILMG